MVGPLLGGSFEIPRIARELLASTAFLIVAFAILRKLPYVPRTWFVALSAGFVGGVLLSQKGLPADQTQLCMIAAWALFAAAVGIATRIFAQTGDRRHVLSMVGIVVACALVGTFSGENGGGGAFLRFLLSLGLPENVASTVVVTVRKGIHLSFYGLCAGLVYRMGHVEEESPRQTLPRAIGFALALACFDEFRQTGAAGRGGSLSDVGVDLLGATLGITFFRIVKRRPRAS